MTDTKKPNPFKKDVGNETKSENNISTLFSGQKDDGERKLTPAVDAKYTLIGLKPGVVIFKGISVDLRSIDLETAEQMIEAGFKYFVQKEKEQKKTN